MVDLAALLMLLASLIQEWHMLNLVPFALLGAWTFDSINAII